MKVTTIKDIELLKSWNIISTYNNFSEGLIEIAKTVLSVLKLNIPDYQIKKTSFAEVYASALLASNVLTMLISTTKASKASKDDIIRISKALSR